MREDLEQQEQMQALKAYWELNRRWIISVFVALALGVSGFNGWKIFEANQKSKASRILSEIQENIDIQNFEITKKLIVELKNNYDDSLQRGLAGLMYAKALVADDQIEAAENELRSLLEHFDSGVSWLARIRLVGLLLDLRRPSEAAKLIPESIPPEWTALANDRKGDAFSALGKFDEAEKLWGKALKAYSLDSSQLVAANMVSKKLATLKSEVIDET